MRPFLLQMAGMPGSGKSTLAQSIAEQTHAVILDKDVIQSAALRSGAEQQHAGGMAYEVLFDLAGEIAQYGHSIIVDSAAFFPIIITKGKCIADENRLAYKVIECVCPNDLLSQRLASRESRSSQWTTLKDIDMEARPGAEPLSHPHLTVDTTEPLESIVAEALEYIGR
jgi:predicted kinase